MAVSGPPPQADFSDMVKQLLMSLAQQFLQDFEEHTENEFKTPTAPPTLAKRLRDREHTEMSVDEALGSGENEVDAEIMEESDSEEDLPVEAAAVMKEDERFESKILPGTRAYRESTVLVSDKLKLLLEDIANTQVCKSEIYRIIKSANEVISMIDVDVAVIYRRLRDLYAERFPELEQLFSSALDYARIVKAIGSETDIKSVDLEKLVPPAAVMVIQMTYTRTTGISLDVDKQKEVMETADLIVDLHNVRNQIFAFIEEQITELAPNVVAIIGTSIAARLIGFVGGLDQLSRVPASNVLCIGSVEDKITTGLSSFGSKHRGIIFKCDLVQSSPSDLQQKIMRMVASKVVLAARVDMVNSHHTNSLGSGKSAQVGFGYRDMIEKRLAKLQEPPPKKVKKALPIPLEKPKPKRGGKKYRRMKERMQITELQKQRNRMGFNKAEDDDYGSELGLGLLGSTDSGKVRIAAQDTQKLSKSIKFIIIIFEAVLNLFIYFLQPLSVN